jgi:hypothetical protein
VGERQGLQVVRFGNLIRVPDANDGRLHQAYVAALHSVLEGQRLRSHFGNLHDVLHMIVETGGVAEPQLLLEHGQAAAPIAIKQLVRIDPNREEHDG